MKLLYSALQAEGVRYSDGPFSEWADVKDVYNQWLMSTAPHGRSAVGPLTTREAPKEISDAASRLGISVLQTPVKALEHTLGMKEVLKALLSRDCDI